MGVAMGWLAVALVASDPAALTDEPKAEITYRVQMVEARGLDWRGTQGLRPVAQHGAISVWTTPDDFLDRLPNGARIAVDEPTVVKGAETTPVHLTTRKTQAFITQVVHRGKDRAPRPITENVRQGVVATFSGRKLDQGVLAKIVIDDVDVRSVHTLETQSTRHAVQEAVEAPPQRLLVESESPNSITVSVTASMETDANGDGDEGVDGSKGGWLPSKSTAILAQSKCQAASCEAGVAKSNQPKTDAQTARAGWSVASAVTTATTTTNIQIPEIGYGSAAGEWLIPDGDVLVIGFGPHTVADAEGKAVVRERLAIVSAEASDSLFIAPLNVEELQLQSLPRLPEPAPPRTAAALPELPSRQIPQGVHADGTPAPLPTVPEDEASIANDAEASGEPRPTPQTRRKPATGTIEHVSPPPAEEAKPVEGKAIKSSFNLPPIKGIPNFQPLTDLVGSSLLTTSFQGARFLVPLKPLAVKLPFNRKLEFELVGRIVDDPEAPAGQFVMGN